MSINFMVCIFFCCFLMKDSVYILLLLQNLNLFTVDDPNHMAYTFPSNMWLGCNLAIYIIKLNIMRWLKILSNLEFFCFQLAAKFILEPQMWQRRWHVETSDWTEMCFNFWHLFFLLCYLGVYDFSPYELLFMPFT